MAKQKPKLPESFYDQVYELVCEIPFGKVTTYGTIAKKLGSASSSRMVGYALNCAKNTNIPCHRVVNRFGALSGKIHFQTPTQMRELLQAEGVGFKPDGTVDMTSHYHDFNT